jgi:hypothetical protein
MPPIHFSGECTKSVAHVVGPPRNMRRVVSRSNQDAPEMLVCVLWMFGDSLPRDDELLCVRRVRILSVGKGSPSGSWNCVQTVARCGNSPLPSRSTPFPLAVYLPRLWITKEVAQRGHSQNKSCTVIPLQTHAIKPTSGLNSFRRSSTIQGKWTSAVSAQFSIRLLCRDARASYGHG